LDRPTQKLTPRPLRAGIGVQQQSRQAHLPQQIRDIAWKGEVRPCARYRRLMTCGKLKTVVTTAIAREIAAFLWNIAHFA